MCGICGIVQPRGTTVAPDVLRQMRDTMAHRGPDGADLYLDAHVGLGHRRLRIIDLSDLAAQPMVSSDGNTVVVHNGEIYNFEALRRELESHGRRFRSRSDTEVILAAWREWGSACVEHFNGMFAFAIYDRTDGTLFLARDRLGVKPLYYHRADGAFHFASEIKAFFAVPGIVPVINDLRLTEQLLYRSLADEQTLFHGIHALLPGHSLTVSADGGIRTQQYWDIAFTPSLDAPEAELEEDVLALLLESVELQEVGDVPIGVQLSGGIDSALVTAAMARPGQPQVQSFTAGFAEPGFSELAEARAVSSRYHTGHHEVIQHQRDFVEVLDTLTWHHDEPLAHSNAAGIYSLCRAAKPFATVLLTGEGADETFAGYHRYAWLRKHATARRWLTPLAPLLPARASGRLASLRLALTRSPQEFIALSTARGFADFAPHLDPTVVQQTIARRAALLAPAATASLLNQALYYDLKSYLPPILMRQDKMSMAHGVETRVPFLDHRLVELAFRLPDQSRLHRGTGKWMLKRIAERYLPKPLAWRAKNGFSFPLAPWLRDPNGLGGRLDLIMAERSLSRQLLPGPVLEQLIAGHRSGRADHAEALWTLLAMESWKSAFFGGK
ncbi:MAG: asparagine synthase (glutamine-hydrolyzing) [Gemmatimonadales bacterium]